MSNRKSLSFEQGWDIMQKGITKLKNILEGYPESQFSPEQYMTLYLTVIDMCLQKPRVGQPQDGNSQRLYDRYRETFEEYITSTVLPSLREKHDDFGLLSEFVRRWSNHKLMVRWLSRFFQFLERYFIPLRFLLPLNEVGFGCFRHLVYEEVKGKVRNAVISLIDQEREGEQIDRALLKNAVDIFVEMGNGGMEYYEIDFESSMLKGASAYYSRKASKWISVDSFPDYVLKAEECMEREKDRTLAYLHASSEPKLLEKVRHELLYVYATHLLENGFLPLLRNDKVVDLSKIPQVRDCVSSMFKQVYKEVKGKVRDTVIYLIHQEREGEQIDRALLKNVVDVFVEFGKGQMQYYENDFESYMLKDTSAYYSREASNWILDYSCSDYMLKAEECLNREKDRALVYLHASSEAKLLEKVRHELLSVYAIQLLENEQSGFLALLGDDKVVDLSRMYRLFSKLPRVLDHLSGLFKQHVTAETTTLAKQAEDAASNKKAGKRDVVGLQEQVFVRKVIELHDKYLTYVNDCFNNHTIFHKVLEEAFEMFCNKGVAGSSSAELLATLCDNILKKGGSEKLSDEDVEDTFDKVVKRLVYISDRDVFANFYRKKLAWRLLFDKSASDEHERSIVSKLKQRFGGQFTSKIEGMVTDLALAKENQSDFEEYLANNSNVIPGVDLTVTVLTTGFWPSYKSFDLNLPAEMVKCVEVFREFFETKTKHRKLTWIYSLGTRNINGRFEPKTMELIVTTYQASALLLFNSSDRLSYQEIMSELNVSDDDVVRLLHSLSCAKYKILIKEPNTKTISPTDTFAFNSKFTDKMRRIKIPLPPADEKKKVIENVNKDRRYAIDALVVRIMKSRKVLGYQQLVMECVEQLGHMFRPDVKAIKKRIDDLITREYLERDRENPNLFRRYAIDSVVLSELDPLGEWNVKGEKALSNPRTLSGLEPLERLYF